ncbi:MAG: hypothetical protein JWO92_1228 [Chitinophagaceae bacterium]|nr:hypothetical protein [Chitinophagaceae bacterium]
MKKFKISFLGVFAVLIGMMASSFSVKHLAKKETGVWFTYDGIGEKYEPSSYVLHGGDPGCDNTTELCAVRATNVNDEPDEMELQTLYFNGDLDEPGSGDVEFGEITP